MIDIRYSHSKNLITNDIFDRATQYAKSGKKTMIITPEQFSFESEKLLYQKTRGMGLDNISVTHIPKLVKEIVTSAGESTLKFIDEDSKYILMSLAVASVKDELTVFSGGYKDYLPSEMLNLVTEFAHSRVDSVMLDAAAKNSGKESLKAKTHDILLIKEAYTALVEKQYTDPIRLIERAIEIVGSTDIFKNTGLFFISFDYFTALQTEFFVSVADVSDTIVLGLCSNTVIGAETTGYKTVTDCVERILKSVVDKNIDFSDPVYIESEDDSALSHLQKNYGKNEVDKIDSDGAVMLINPRDKYSEVEQVAIYIAKLCRTGKYRYKDFLVSCRDMASYKSLVKIIFDKYEIPYFLDEKTPLISTPIFSAVMSALDCIVGKISTEKVLRLLKTQLFDIKFSDICRLENYLYVWDIDGDAWYKDFTESPDGALGRINEIELKKLNIIRRKSLSIIDDFKEEILNATTAKEFCTGIYNFLWKMKFDKEIIDDIKLMDAEYNQLIFMLNNLSKTGEENGYNLKEYIKILKQLFTRNTIGMVPQFVDTVQVGQASRVRSHDKKIVVVMGINEGVFPKTPASGKLFNLTDKESLKDQGIRLPAGFDDALLDEYYYLGNLCAMAGEKILLSYISISDNFTESYPSELIPYAEKYISFTGDNSMEFEDSDYILTSAAATEKTLDKRLAQTVKSALDKVGNETYKQYCDILKPVDYKLSDDKKIKEVLGDKMEISPTRIEQYFSCKFAYFCEYILRLKNISKAELTPIESGTIVHYALEQLMKDNLENFVNMTDEETEQEIYRLLNEFINENFKVLLSGGRNRELLNRVESTLNLFAKHARNDLNLNEFRPKFYELDISADGLAKPMEIKLSDGSTILVGGKVDRVDMCSIDGVEYMRIIDYKTGVKKFKLSDIYHGLNMQMLVYLFAICDSEKFSDVTPAGVLYMPVKNFDAKVDRNAEYEEIENARQNEIDVSGLLIDDKNVLARMDKELKGEFIPKYGKNEKFADAEKMQIIKKHIKSMIGEMGEHLRSGDIKAVPTISEYDACKYCNYKKICRIQDSDPVNDISGKGSSFYKMIEVENDG